MSPRGRDCGADAYTVPAAPATLKIVGLALGRMWRPPAIDLELLTFVTGGAFEETDPVPPGRRFRIFDGAATVASHVMMVAKCPGIVVFISVDHAIVRVNGAVYALAANKPMVLSVPGTAASIAIRHGGCRLPVVPATDTAALLDTTGATNVCYRPAAAFPGFVEAVPVSGAKWLCPGCGVEHHHLDAMWAHLKAPGPAPGSLQPLMPSPPRFGSPMTSHDENTVVTSPALNKKLHARLEALAAPVRHGSGDGRGRQHGCGPHSSDDVGRRSALGRDNGRGHQPGSRDSSNRDAGHHRRNNEGRPRGGYGAGRSSGGFGASSGHYGGGRAGAGKQGGRGRQGFRAAFVSSHYHGNGQQRGGHAVDRRAHGNGRNHGPSSALRWR